MKKPITSSLILGMMTLFSCQGNQPLETVNTLDLQKYEGVWYEITKLPNRFEKGLKCVSAEYTVRPDGKIKVYNKGYNTQKNKWEEITGVAKVPDPERPGVLKVSFFRPFYGDYYVLDIDEDYETALVGSPSRKYLWILGRSKEIDEARLDELIKKAASLSFDVSKLEPMVHDCR